MVFIFIKKYFFIKNCLLSMNPYLNQVSRRLSKRFLKNSTHVFRVLEPNRKFVVYSVHT